jgi:Protein of unknown function DUF86
VKGDRLYLTHILDAVEKIETYISVGHDVFVSTSHWQDAVIRQLEIIGEATKRLSKQLCSQHPEVPWRRIAGLRATQKLAGSSVGSCIPEFELNRSLRIHSLGSGLGGLARSNGSTREVHRNACR